MEAGSCGSVGVRGDGVGVVVLFCRRGGHEYGKVAGEGNALMLSRVDKGREQWGISSL